MAVESLHVGDFICLYSEDSHGFVYSYLSSSIHTDIAVKSGQDRQNPVAVDPASVTFEICVVNRYKFDKKFRKAKYESISNEKLAQLQLAAEAESDDNENEKKRQFGRKVLYGQTIQLRHLFTQKFIHSSTETTATTKSGSMKVFLSEYNAKNAQFKIMPRYKVKAEGDIVQVEDQIVFESVKTPGQYLHVSKSKLPSRSVYKDSLELNLSVKQSGFRLLRRYKPSKEMTNFLKSGHFVRFFHKEIEAYLCASGLLTGEIADDVHLRIRPVDQNIPKTLFPSTSAITYWQVELLSSNLDGSEVKWHQQCRLKHVCTRLYLLVNHESVSLTKDANNPNTVFKLHPVIQEHDNIEYETYCRIEHVVSGYWLHASLDDFVDSKTSKVIGYGENSMDSLKWTTACLKTIGAIKEMQYDDAFTLQKVENIDCRNFYYAAGIVPVLLKLIEMKTSGLFITESECNEIVSAINELEDFLIVNSEPDKNRQKLMRNLMIVELVVQILQFPNRGNKDSVFMTNICVECYNLLYTYLMGNSRKNELYIAKYIHFFKTQISVGGEVGLSATQMVMELIRDNRKIVDRINKEHIDEFVDLLKVKKNYHYLDLLSVLCVCDGVSIPENQSYIAQKWLKDGDRSCVYLTELGEKIGKTPKVVYVATKKHNWKPLQEFMETAGKDETLFLEHQLDLFENLCHGRNPIPINIIANDLCYLTWEEAYLCLSDEMLPDQLRAQYCNLIISLFIDIDKNSAVMERINLTFSYDELDEDEVLNHDDLPTSGTEHFKELHVWLSKFFDDNKDMTASDIGHNVLIEQVLRLVHYLISLGFYRYRDDIRALLPPFFNLLDGRNDKPYKSKDKISSEVMKHYRTIDRYKQSREGKAIVDAKVQAIRVLDLVFNYRFESKLKRFIREFKLIYEESNKPDCSPTLGQLLTREFKPSPSLSSTAMKRLKEMSAKSGLFAGLNIDFIDIFKDLSLYEYDTMVTGSMSLINRFFTSNENLFQRAIQAQILINDESSRVQKEIHKLLPIMNRLTTIKMSSEQIEQMIEILDEFRKFCSLENEPEEPHPMNQAILYNHSIISSCFAIFSLPLDFDLKDQYSGMRRVLAHTFLLLKHLTRSNKTVQERLFNRLDILLTVEGAEPELGEALVEVFTGNKDTCMNVLPQHIQKLMHLVAKHKSKAPQFLDVLNALVKVEELDLPLKRNQAYVMKYFMQFRTDIAFVIDQPVEKRNNLLKSTNEEADYLASLVDLLATCAEGENQSIETQCQTIFTINELLDVLNKTDIDNHLKRPYLRFLLWVYLNTAGGGIDSAPNEINHNKNMWTFIEQLSKHFQTTAKYAEDNPEAVIHLLKKAPTNSVEHSEKEHGGDISHHSTLHFLFDAALPFLQVFFSIHYQIDKENYSNEETIVQTLGESLMYFTRKTVDLISNPTHMNHLVYCMRSVLSQLSNIPSAVMEEFKEIFAKSGNVQCLKSESRKQYDEDYQHEEEINTLLNTFSKNFAIIYGGENTVRAQTGYPSDEYYFDPEGDEILPLGQEFQDHLSVFIDEKEKVIDKRYALARKLVQQLEISSTTHHVNERDIVIQEKLDVKCIKLIRGLIHNEIVKLPPDWLNTPKLHTKALKMIEDVQNSLNSYNAILPVLSHLAKNNSEIIREVLAFQATMLFGGNERVQHSLIDYFLGTREEKFFQAIKNRMQYSSIAIKEKRSLMAQHQEKIRINVDQAKALKKAMQQGKAMELQGPMGNGIVGSGKSQARIMLGSRALGSRAKLGSRALGSRMNLASSRLNISPSPYSYSKNLGRSNGKIINIKSTSNGSILGNNKDLENTKISFENNSRSSSVKKNQVVPIKTSNEMTDEELEAMVKESLGDVGDMEYKDDGYINLVLKLLGLMCDGQNTTLQDYLREQPDNIKSVNLISETARFLSLLYSSIDSHSIGLVTELLGTLVEFTSGNATNQTVVFDNKIIDYINFILRGAQFQTCDDESIRGLKMAVINLLVSLVEERNSGGHGVAYDVAEAIDFDSIFLICIECYQRRKEEQVLDLGFKYFHFLLKVCEIEEKTYKYKPENEEIWKFYNSVTLSIEILKDNQLQKVYFRVKDRSVLRDDVKEKFKYEVDRSSPSNKLRDFMEWSKDIIRDIKYTRKVLSNPFSRFFVKFWYPFNMLMIFISLIIFITIMITWKAPQSGSTIKPDYRYDFTPIIIYIFGGLHNAVTLCVTISYFITNSPKLPNIGKFIRKYKSSDKEDIEEEEEEVEGNLRVNFLSFETLWYIGLFIFSILGTIFWGYFFSFHLLHVAQFNQMLKRAIKAVTLNGYSMLWVFLFGLVFIYIYALISFAAFRDLYPGKNGLFCSTMYECAITVLHHGFITGAYEYLQIPEDKNFTYYIYKVLFDLTFWLIITTIGLNIIFGIIVDTFSELRDNKWQVENDMRSSCFICSKASYDFEHHGGGFEEHVKKEHNLWAYLFFFIHLDETRWNDYTSIELHVHKSLERETYDFFPLNRALSLRLDEDSNEMRMESMAEQIFYIASKLKEEEAEKMKAMERKRDLEWEQQHKSNKRV
ncbi:DgyrCDS2578 [Dimorphilus gyrociliatus]|uniref:Inositol 1,4,5-trisphosphate receptor n=1 Tax=Dimorphilus gyrociliatus TaxID=2664684 RepID=A0A7I8VFV8_9ANNE|nr:DgyrCDS2578 [Dimorphilus gyrociliatus]